MIHKITRNEITRSNTNNISCQFVSLVRVVSWIDCLLKQSAIKPRRALLTALSFGKTLATCGSSTMTFVDFRIRLAYLPRTNSPKSDRLYCVRNQSLSSDLAFFIDCSVLQT